MMVDIDAAEARALRALDGMTVNREVMAKELVSLCQEVRRWRKAHAEAKPVEKVELGKPTFEEMMKSFGFH